ncbi:molybdenum cofactor cytidylyltransferase [Paenibacillus sophorae]|uniref:Molybdenum cofactor cytidylyltransferase n=1 Tax=Paenibacillus sophorae TaxID=1333845 RepID=A0A1H8KWV5_9BACL|nr:NTP transferase domain-containing protein [Paenibacillus sophorae]QWU17529.1 NTP transferase domain-containing protein [Paenibacillus sophorae]SEN97339.1 molybdenum cofactor cytidylyltransferase [Paenibacillus sophorae]
MRVAGIYLAAGQSSRMGTSKVSLRLSQDVALGSVALSELERCGLEPLAVVVRADDKLEWLPPESGVPGSRRTETCLTAHLGLSFSLRCGLNAVLPAEPDAVVVALADQPFITAGLIGRLIETFRSSPTLDYVASKGNGTVMPPALFSKSLFPALQQLDGDRGAAGIFRSPDYKGAVIEGESPLFFMDADTEGDFREVHREWMLRSDRKRDSADI